MRPITIPAISLALGAIAAGCGGTTAPTTPPAASPSTSASCGGSTGGTTVTTSKHIFTAHLGAGEHMYTQAQVDDVHPTDGELMLGGEMQDMGADAMATMSGRHVEVAICDVDGRVITDATPTMRVGDGANGVPVPIKVATMRGVDAGPDETHYGNNVMIMKDTARLLVTLDGDTATLVVKAG